MNKKTVITIMLIVFFVVLISVGTYFTLNRQTGLSILNSQTDWNHSKKYFYNSSKKQIPLKFVGIKYIESFNNNYPHFLLSTGAEVALTDELTVKIKPGTTRENLDTLNRKYNVSIVKNLYDTNDVFRLTVKNDPSNNALDMANLYYDQMIIEWTVPNFIHLSIQPL